MTAHAIESPSIVDVPRPISSRINKDLSVALFRIVATSTISTINVLCPSVMSSDAPTRVKMRSVSEISAESAGTNEPI